MAVKAEPLSYVVLDRNWNDGDTVTAQLPMTVAVRTWAKNGNAVSVDYGPLTFSLKIGEKYVRYGGASGWPSRKSSPRRRGTMGWCSTRTTQRASSRLSARRPGPISHSRPTAYPLPLKARAKKLPGWTLDRTGLVAKLRPSPVRSDEPEETVTLIPMGAARLRITAFPHIGSGPDAHAWPARNDVIASASHVFTGDTLDALDDGLVPASSGDHGVPRFTWWDHKGTAEWVQYSFTRPREVAAVKVYWFDDTGKGGCRLPASWKLLYRDGDSWRPVQGASPYGVQADRFNEVTFTPVRTTGLRLDVQLQKGFSGGILEWQVAP